MNKEVPNEPEIAPQLDFPVVAIGASAGGLEAVTEMIHGVENGVGMAFVLIMHLDPNHESMMAELLASKTGIKVRQITQDDRIEMDCLHVIPPGSSLRIDGGQFKLDPFSEPRGLRRPIDSFFRSLAQAQTDRAACVVLSGTGADGTAGLRAIKEFGGVCAVQSPEEARHDGMPVSAISTNLADFVMEADQIVGRLRSYFDGSLRDSLPDNDLELEAALQRIFAVLRDRVGIDFGGYKRTTLLRRLRRRLQVLEIENVEDYLASLEGSESEKEHEALARDFLINVTSFFRDPEYFEIVRKIVIPTLLKKPNPKNDIRIWVPGCSSGQEAYTIAMMVADACEELMVYPLIQIFATDVDEDMIEQAREASYPVSMYSEIPAKYREKYVIASDERFEISHEIRRMVRFSTHNIIQNPPFSKIDFISCRNLLIYLGESLQSELFPLLHFSLRPHGYLLLGPSESITKSGDLFHPINLKARLFKRNDVAKRIHVNLPLGSSSRDGVVQRGIGKLSRETDFPRHQTYDASSSSILEQYAPPFIRVNSEGRIIDSSGDLSLFMMSRPGDDNNLETLARDGLSEVVSPLVAEAVASGERRSIREIEISSPFGTQKTDIVAHPMKDQSAAIIFLVKDRLQPVVDQYATRPISRDRRIADLQDELKGVRLDLKSKVEEIETANEELKSSNEEMMSMNEELQSANEELTTANEELKNKIDELTLANVDLDNFLQSADLAMIVLDRESRIRHITNAARDILPLMRSDEGRMLSEFNIPAAGIAIGKEVRKAMESGEAFSGSTDPNEEGRTFFLRITPYFFPNGTIEGASITLLDITDEKNLRSTLAAESRKLQLAVDTAGMGSWETDLDTGIMQVDEVSARLVGLDDHGSIDPDTFLKNLSPKDDQGLAKIRKKTLDAKEPSTYTARIDHPDGGSRWLRLHANPFTGEDGHKKVLGLAIDVTDLMQLQEDLRWESEKLHNAVEAARMGVREVDPETWETKVDAVVAEYLHLDGPGVYSIDDTLANLQPDDARELRSQMENTAETGEEYETDYCVTVPDEPLKYYRSRGFRVIQPDGKKKVVALSFETTADKHQQLLVEEMSHRIKNLFAVVTGLIQSAPREHEEAEKIANDLLERVVALGRVYDLARKGNATTAVALSDLLSSVVKPHATTHDLAIEGPTVLVDGDTVNTLTLIVHEMATNAAKYGCFASPEGTLAISWEVDSERHVSLEWREETPEFQRSEEGSGFGGLLIDTGVRQLKGSFQRSYTPKGAFIEIEFNL